jgi:hypothetical protein
MGDFPPNSKTTLVYCSTAAWATLAPVPDDHAEGDLMDARIATSAPPPLRKIELSTPER